MLRSTEHLLLPGAVALVFFVILSGASVAQGQRTEESPAGCELSEPKPSNDPATCRELWEKIGLPTFKGSAGEASVPVCHKRYILMHNNERRIPDWVLQHLTREQVSGDESRPKIAFKPEPDVPACAQAVDKDYRGSKFARGHQAPSEDFNIDQDLMKDTFFFSNVVPQIGNGFNSGIWSTLEEKVRDLAKSRGELFVITGPIYQDPEGASQTITAAENACGKTIKLDALPKTKRPTRVCAAGNQKKAQPCGDEGAAVPSALFKIIYDPINDRANAYVLPNVDHKELKGKVDALAYLENFRTTVHVVEEYTGVSFLTALPKREQRQRKQQCGASMFR